MFYNWLGLKIHGIILLYCIDNFVDNFIFSNSLFFRKTYLYQVLIAIANTYKEVGYVQGLNYIAGLLLMKYKSACLTFNLISFIFEDLKLIDLMKKSFPMLGLLNYQLDLFLKFYMFDIYSHLVNKLIIDTKN